MSGRHTPPSAMQSDLTRHAATRMQQRGVPPVIVYWLQEFGAEEHDKHGGVIRYFDKAAKRRLERSIGRPFVRRIQDLLSAYLVEADGRVVTVGHRHARIRRH